MTWDHVFAGRFNGGEPVCIGGILRDPLSVLAERAVLRIQKWHEPLAVTVEPDGAVYVEPVVSAAWDDVVGVYAQDVFALTIYGDLKAERMSRRAAADAENAKARKRYAERRAA